MSAVRQEKMSEVAVGEHNMEPSNRANGFDRKPLKTVLK
jgi:hypothetical protein